MGECDSHREVNAIVTAVIWQQSYSYRAPRHEARSVDVIVVLQHWTTEGISREGTKVSCDTLGDKSK